MAPKSTEAVSPLADVLKDGNANVRAGAAQAIGRFGPAAADAVPGLTAALRDREANVRMQAAYALAEVGPGAEAALPQLRDLTARERDGNVRGAVVYAADKIQGKR
jgi:hypothetical protein